MSDERRPAAVVLAINERPPHDVVFVERAAHLRSHPGQIALPGGGMDPIDAGDLERTALRELHEEVGIAPEYVRFAGRLSPIRARVNRYVVTPFVAIVADVPLHVEPGELTGAFTVPLTEIIERLTDGVYAFGSFEIETPLLEVGTRTIWGLTGHVLRDFVEQWESAQSPLRARVEALLRAGVKGV